MAFGWVIRHQKKALFVLAVALIVGWGLSGMITRLFSTRRQSAASDQAGRIAGEVVTRGEFQNFRIAWTKVFPYDLGSTAVQSRYAGAPEKIEPDNVAWAYLGLYKMATQRGIRVSDENVVEYKRLVYQMHVGRGADLEDTEQVRRWLRERMAMSGDQLDEILRERLMAEGMLTEIVDGLEPTETEAQEAYRKENRGVRVQYVALSSGDFLAKAAEPSEEDIMAYYEARSGAGGEFFRPAAVQIEYAQVRLAKAEAECKITTEEMKKYYDENKDLYHVNESKGQGPESEYLPFPEVKPEIEATLRGREARAKAYRALGELAKAYRETAGAQLETHVKANKEGLIEYFRSPLLTQAELLLLPGIGAAEAGGRGIGELALDSELNPKEQMLSAVMSGRDGWYVLRPVASRAAGSQDFSEVKSQVVLELKKAEALSPARAAAMAFARDLEKAGGASKFEAEAATHHLVVKETPFFVNSGVDVNRPLFIDRNCPLETGQVYGPLASARDGVAAVVKVIAERPADPAGFAGERELERDSTWKAKRRDFVSRLFPLTVLEFAGYKNLLPPPPAQPEPSEE